MMQTFYERRRATDTQTRIPRTMSATAKRAATARPSLLKCCRGLDFPKRRYGITTPRLTKACFEAGSLHHRSLKKQSYGSKERVMTNFRHKSMRHSSVGTGFVGRAIS